MKVKTPLIQSIVCLFIFTMTPALHAQTCVAQPSGLVGSWTGDGTAVDLISTNHGTLVGNATYTNGNVNAGFVLDGDRDGIYLGNAGALKVQNFTIETWLRRTSTNVVTLDSTAHAHLLTFGLGGYVFGIKNDGRIDLGNVGNNEVATSAVITDTNFHHVAVTKTNSSVTFYVDGVAVSSPTYNTTFSFITPAAIGFNASAGAGASNSFLGVIDEMSFYTRALSSTEIQSVVNASTYGKCRFAPAITQHPQSVLANTGDTVSFTVMASGTPLLYYQWTCNGTNMAGATSTILAITNVTSANVGAYNVTVTNGAGFATSSNANLVLADNQSCVAQPSGLVGAWTGDGTALDLISTNHGTLVGNATYANAKVNSGFQLDGDRDGIYLGSAGALKVQNFTIETWLRRTSTNVVTLDSTAHAHLLTFGIGGYVFGIKDDGRIDLGNVGNNEVTTSAVITDTNFHHVAVTKTNSSVTFYVDGVVISSPTYNTTFTFNTPVAIGYNASAGAGASNSFLGVIDEMSFYNRALSSTEIQSIVNASASGKCRFAPAIAQHPKSVLANPGDTVSFTVSASGTAPLYYQWTCNGTNLAGATNSILVLTNLTVANVGAYNVTVTNSVGYLTSSNANLVLVTNQSCVAPQQEIVGWWNAEGHTVNLVDTSAGVLVGNATYTNGVVGQAFSLDGSGDAVNVGNPTTLQLQNFTIEAWIKRGLTNKASQTAGSGGVIFGYGSNGYALVLQDDGRLALSKAGSSGVFSTNAINDTNFHHVAVTKTNSTVYFYIDGVGVLSSAYDPGFTFTTSAAIGAKGDDYTGGFLGTIDELSIYNRALSASQIQALYNAGSSGKCSLPAIIINPESQAIVPNNFQSTLMSGVAIGSVPVGFQWYFNGTNLPAATNSMLRLADVTSSELGSYYFTFTNPFGAVTSQVAILSAETNACTAPSSGLIAWWPANGIANDAAEKFSPTIKGNATYTRGKSGYGFLFDGQGDAVDVGNPSELQRQNFTIEAWVKRNNTIKASQTAGGGLFLAGGDHGYAFGMTDAGNLLLSKVGVDGVFSTFTITDTNFHHVAVTRTNGVVIFYKDGVASGSLSYSTQFEFTKPICIGALSDLTAGCFIGVIDELAIYSRILGASEIQSIYNAGSGGKCVLPPSIISQPQSLQIAAGSTAQLAVMVETAHPVTYQWWFESIVLSGRTSSSLVITNAQTTNGGNYFVVVSNTLGVLTSAVAQLTVVVPPSITNQPTNQVVVAGATTTFSASLQGSQPLNYQWFFNGTAIIGGTNATLIISNTLPENVGTYQLIVTNSVGATTSSIVTLNLNPLIKVAGLIGSSFNFTNSNSVPVQILTTSSNAAIFYTLDGTTPDFNARTYTGPFNLTNATTIRAIVYDTNFNTFESSPVSVALWFYYPLTISNPGGGTVSLSPTGGVYWNGTTVQLTATPTNGWTFLRWSGDATGTNSVVSVTMDRAKTVQPIFGTTISAATNQNGVIKFNPSLSTYPFGGLVQIAGIPNSGYSFGLWGGSATGNTNPLPFIVTNPTPSISALFSTLTAGRYSLVVVPNGQGTVTVTPRSNVYTNGDVVTVTANPIGTNQFLGWSGDASGTNNPLSVTMNGSKVIYANFRGGDYPLKLNATILTNNGFVFVLSGEPQTTIGIESSSNLLTWLPVAAVTNTNGTVQVSDSTATNSAQKFYRAVAQ